ncbi:hypothetical protein A5762_15645 [Mycolicibacterium elephantis]|nr:hypothetical protein A5762_15645 [Mycolicibacterium elephantis]
MKNVSDLWNRISHQIVGYLMLLLALGSLGLMIAGLALKSELAPVAGIAFVITLIAAVEGFRNGAAKLREMQADNAAGHHVSIWTKPVEQEEIDRYHATYRDAMRSQDSPSEESEQLAAA